MSTAEVFDPPAVARTAIAEYSPTEIALADLRRRTKDVLFEVTTTSGMDAARKARAEIRGYRVDLEAKRVELKAPVLERGRLLDAEAKRITAELTALEEPIDEQIKAEEKRKADERARRDREEQERIAGIHRQLDAIRQMPLGALGKTVGGITADLIAAQDIDVDAFPVDYREEAQRLVDEAVAKLTAMRDQRRAADVEAKRLAAERAQLEAEQRAARERQQQEDAVRAERQRAEDAARAARQREEDDARAASERAAQAERDRVAAEQRAENERIAEENRLERERLATERARQAEAERAARAAEHERAIAEATLLDAATDAHAFLIALGEEDALETRKLGAAVARETS